MICEYNIFNEVNDKLKERRIYRATRALNNFLMICENFPNKLPKNMTKGEAFIKLRKLVNNKVDMNQRFGNLVEKAVLSDNATIVKIMLSNPVATVSKSAVYTAVFRGNTDIMKLFLEETNFRWGLVLDNSYNTILSEIAAKNDMEMFKLLLSSDKILDVIRNQNISMILKKLIYNHHDEYIKLLLPFTLYNGEEDSDNSVLSMAVEKHNIEIIRELLNYSYVIKSDMYTPFRVAVHYGFNDCADILIKYVHKFPKDSDYGITLALESKNIYALDLILDAVDWGKVKLEKWINIETYNNLYEILGNSENLGNYPIQKLKMVLSKYPKFLMQFDYELNKFIKPTYTPKKFNRD